MLTPAELAAAFATAVADGTGDRRIERTVTLHDHEDGAKTVAVFSTMHNKDAKVFMGNIKIIRKEPPRQGSVFSVTTWIPFERSHNKRLAPIPAARYSAKALDAAHAEHLATLTDDPSWLDSLDLGPYNPTL